MTKEAKKASSIRILRLAADDSLIRELSLATGGRGHRHAAKGNLGRAIYDLVVPMFPAQGDDPGEPLIQWLKLDEPCDDYMALTVEIYGPHPGSDLAPKIIEQAIFDHIESQVAHSASRTKFEKTRIVAHII